MKRIVPILVHHETGEKAQIAGKKNQEYLRYCIAQAKKYNPKVVLFGDSYNREWCDDWHAADDYLSDKWREFYSVFENYSTYPQSWAEGIFKRFFLFLEYMEREGFEECVVLDSDILLYLDVSAYEPLLHCRVAAETPKEQDLSCLPPGNGLQCYTSGGFSYFTREALSEFTDFCIDTYRDHKDLLLTKWEAHQKYGLPGGVCEMSLLHLWIRTLPEGQYLNLLKEDPNHAVFDQSFASSGGYLENQYEFIRCLGIKRLHWENGKPYCYTVKDHRRNDFLMLHFGGETKIFMEGIYKKQRCSLSAKLTTCLVKCRGYLSAVKHGHTGWQQRLKLRHAAR